MRGQWLDIRNVNQPSGGETLRGFFRASVMHDVNKLSDSTTPYPLIVLADFVYDTHEARIIKSRNGNIERLYAQSQQYMNLKYHENEQVRLAFEKVETLAALAEDSH